MKIFATLLLAFSLHAVTAQTKFGLKAGASLYHFTGKDASPFGKGSQKFKPGFVAGAFADVPAGKMVFIQPGLFYSAEGNIQKTSAVDQTYKLNYLNLPVVVKLQLPVGFFGEAGLQGSYLLSAIRETSINNATTKVTSTDGLHSFLLAPVIGCGWQFKNGIGINARSQWGITSVGDNTAKVYNSGFYGSVFYRF